MPKYEFTAAINVRAYGTITVEAEDIAAAKATIQAPGFEMAKSFSPHGGGDDDFNWDHDAPAIYLGCAYIDDEPDAIDLHENLFVQGEVSMVEVMECLTHALAICEAEVELRGENDTDDYQGGAAGPLAERIRRLIAKAEARANA